MKSLAVLRVASVALALGLCASASLACIQPQRVRAELSAPDATDHEQDKTAVEHGKAAGSDERRHGRDDDESGQTPPAQSEIPVRNCVTDHSGFRQERSKSMFVIELRNQCEKAFRCTVNAYLVTAQGPIAAKRTMRLGPKSAPKRATKTHGLPLKVSGGMANLSRQCKAL